MGGVRSSSVANASKLDLTPQNASTLPTRGEGAEHAAQLQTHVLKKPEDRRLFLLTTEPHDDLSGKLRWQAWAWLAAGVLGLVYGGAGLLMRA